MRYRFLIVDDTLFMRKMAADSLKQFDYEVAGEAANGVDAIEKYKELKPDIVLMDLTMPEMNGVDAIKRILWDDPAAVILVCSASNQKDMIDEALEAGAKGYLTKPFKPEFMEQVIRKYALPHVAAKANLQAAEPVEVAATAEVAVHEAAVAEAEASTSVEVAAAVEVDRESVVVDRAEALPVIGKPAANHPSVSSKQPVVSSLKMSYMCSWKEEQDGGSNSYIVTCSDQENKLVVEWTGSSQEKQSIHFSLKGFQQLAGWLDQQVLVRK